MNSRTDESDKRIAVLLCQMIDSLHFHTTLFDEVGAERVKHWIKSRAAAYIAAREVGLVESEAFKNYWN
jgi:hypothetical protein